MEPVEEKQPTAPKKWHTSKTFRFSGGLAALGLAVLSIPELQTFIETLPGEYQALVLLIVSAAMAWLRHVTTGPVDTNTQGDSSGTQ